MSIRAYRKRYYHALRMDHAWQAELERIYGGRAGDVRYTAAAQSTPKLAHLHTRWREAIHALKSYRI